jgi:hypothetical protein
MTPSICKSRIVNRSIKIKLQSRRPFFLDKVINSRLNSVSNCTFIEGDLKDELAREKMPIRVTTIMPAPPSSRFLKKE